MTTTMTSSQVTRTISMAASTMKPKVIAPQQIADSCTDSSLCLCVCVQRPGEGLKFGAGAGDMQTNERTSGASCGT